MSLSPLALPFFSCTSPYNLCKRNDFLSKAFVSLSSFGFNLFYEILDEWESCMFLDHCFSKWQKFIPVEKKLSFHFSSYSFIQRART